MFDRLLSLIANHNVSPAYSNDPHSDVRLATAVLLFNMVPVDYQNLAVEGTVLAEELMALLHIGPRRCHKLIARAAAARNVDPSIFAAAQILKRKTTLEFRRSVLAAINAIALADGQLHPHEQDLTLRAARLLDDGMQLAA